MSDKKIMIRNCPNITFIDYWRLDKSKSSYCKLKNCGCENNTDCLLKKIVEKCREHHNDLHFTPSEVLSLIDIEECE